MADEKDNVERAKELLVYLPVGFAMYLREHGPSFMKVFVSRGRSEVERGKHSVGDQIDHARSVGESAVEDNGAPVLKFLNDGLAALRERAEEALSALGVGTPEAEAEPDAAPADDRTSWKVSSSAPTADPLAIPGYDDLSASQIVDRLDGLSPAALEAIRVHETTHRARNTVLGKIEQLTRGV